MIYHHFQTISRLFFFSCCFFFLLHSKPCGSYSGAAFLWIFFLNETAGNLDAKKKALGYFWVLAQIFSEFALVQANAC